MMVNMNLMMNNLIYPLVAEVLVEVYKNHEVQLADKLEKSATKREELKE
jgi:hypothetical protein